MPSEKSMERARALIHRHDETTCCSKLTEDIAATIDKAVAAGNGEQRARIDTLAMFVRRLYRKLRKHEPNAEVIQQANTYLKAIGQAGTPFRAEEVDGSTRCADGQGSGPLPGRDITVVKESGKTKFVATGRTVNARGEKAEDKC